MVPQEFLKKVATQAGVSKNELQVLQRAIQGDSMTTISKQLGVNKDALQKRLGEVYKKFHIMGAGPGKLAKLQQKLVAEYQRQSENYTVGDPLSYPEVSPVSRSQSGKTRIDWGSAPEPNLFYGRKTELGTLKQWIIKDNCRLVALLGMGGIGKTALAVQAVRQCQHDFDVVVWRSLRRGIALNELLDDLIEALRPEDKEFENSIASLLDLLREVRCLVILDNVEAILEPSQIAGYYRPDYQAYGELFSQLGQSRHNSCVLLIGREKPIDIVSMAGIHLSARSLQLEGLSTQDSQKLLSATQSLERAPITSVEQLTQLYGGNPAALKLIATTIAELFDGNLDQFLQHDTPIIGDVLGRLLSEQFERLSLAERQLLAWLALLDKPVTPLELYQQTAFAGDLAQLLAILESLRRRSLLDKFLQGKTAKLAVQPMVKTYLTRQFAAQLVQLVSGQDPENLKDIDLLDRLGLVDEEVASPAQMTLAYQHLGKKLNEVGYRKYLEGELVSAKFYLHWSVQLNPSHAAAHYNLGSAYEQLNDIESARQHYQTAAKGGSSPAARAAWVNLARLDLLAGQAEDAIARLVPIINEVTDSSIKACLHKNLGWAYLLQGQYDDAERNLELSLDFDRERGTTHALLAQVLEAQGDASAAREHWRNCIECNTPSSSSGEIHWQLPELVGWRAIARQRLQSR
jgi:Tfp pilus assembly protein PilF/DNA-binding CsgD family transcriptional regulator